MLRLAVTAFSTTPKLRTCTQISILASIIIASQVGLEPGVAGQGYLIPYWDSKNKVNVCTFVPGWQGLVGLLNNTGRATIWSGAVFEGDEFEFVLGSSPRLHHRPGDNHGDPTKMTHVYACGKVNGSEQPVIECWTMKRITKHRDMNNKQGDSHYSFRHPEMYARKVVVLQVLKYMPRSIEVNNAIVAANIAEGGRNAEVKDGVIIDMGEAEPIAAGNVGQPGNGGQTLLETAADEKAGAGGGGTPPVDAGPSVESLLSELIRKGSELDAGKEKIRKSLVALKLIEPSEKLEGLDAKRLANILDGWEAIAAEIRGK